MGKTANAPMGWLVGAYAAAPSRNWWSLEDEGAFYRGLWSLPGVVGLELPWKEGAFHARDEQWLLRHLPADADVVVSTAPDAAGRLRASATFGLASTDHDGRRAAIEAMRALQSALARVRDAIPAGRVLAVELHSTPRAEPGAASAAALAQSLEEIAEWDWGGAALTIEHCDAWKQGQKPAKGYLPLADEIAIVGGLRRQGAPVGISVNWGRSVIEARDPDAGRAHVELAAAAGVLEGVIFSGAATAHTPLGAAWADVHAPFAGAGPYASSLLTGERARATLAAAGRLSFQAVKVAAEQSASVADRISVVADALDALSADHPTAR